MEKHEIPYVGIGETLEEAWDFEIVDSMAILGVSYTCYNDKNSVDCKQVARMTDDDSYMRKAIQKIRKDHPEKLIALMMHAGKEYDFFANSYQK